MKRYYYRLRFSLMVGMLTIMLHKSNSQCLVDFTTSNYFCDLDSLYLTAVPVSGTGPFSFIWETGETTQTIIIPLALGDYMLTMTDANGCISIINCHIKPFPDVLYYPYNQNACEGDTVTLFLEWFRDSIPGATYLWSTGETTPTIQLTDDLVWSVTVTDPSNGCEFVIPPGLFDFHPTPYPEIVGSDMICNGETIILSVNGGPFGSIVWYPGGIYEPTLEVTEPGEYIVWGSSPEAGYCWHQDTINITEGVITPPQVTGPPELCAGQTGTVTLTNYALFEEYVWTNGETTSSITVNTPGTYTVTVTSSGGCTATESIIIGSGGGPDLTTDPTASTCGESNGSIDLTATPPQSFEFIWSNGSTSPDLINVPPGNYSVTVTDPNGCTSTASDIVPDNPIDITISETITHNSSCTNYNGAINLFISPVGEPYAFLWSNGATTEDIDNLLPGTYSVTVSTGLNCNTFASYIIEDNSGAAEILPIILPTSCGESNGSISLQLDGGQGPFSYLWSNGNTTEGLNDIPAGTYSVTVTGSDGCISTATIPLPNEDPMININGVAIPNSSCVSGNGEIDVTVAPSGNYSFNWSNGSSTEDLFNLSGGNYTLTVTLGVTCTQTASFTVINENIPFDITGTSSPNTSCTSPNGSIDISVNPVDIYTYLWSTGQTIEDLQNLDQGIYSVTVTNSNGCSISSSFNVATINSAFIVSGLTIANTSCQIPNGVIDINVNPAGAYTYNWSNGENSEDLQSLSGGTYSVTVTSSDGCTADTTFMIDNQAASFTLSAITLDNSSCTNPNGSIDLTVSPTGIYSFLWSNGSLTEDLSSIESGSYGVTVTDINSCSASAIFDVSSTLTSPMITSTITHEVCGTSNGTIDLSVTPVSSSFIWSNGSLTEDLLNIPAGIYSVTVTGPNGCSFSDTFDILNNSNNFTITGTPTDNNSCVVPNGSIDLIILPAGSYNYLWTTGATTEDLQGLDNGIYQVTVTDISSCSSTASFTIQSTTVDPVVYPSIIPSSCGLANGVIELMTTPPTGNTYLWSNGSTTEDIFNLLAGMYSVTVTSSNGCSTTDSFTVPAINSNFTLSGNTTDNTSCTAPNGSINLNVSPAASYTYIWSNGATSEDLQNVSAGLYEVTVTDGFNCSSTFSFNVIDNTVTPELSYNVTPANCGENNGAINLIVNLTTGNTYVWSNGMTTEDLLNIFPGSYSVTVTSVDGCSAAASMIVPNQNSNFSISASIIDDESCVAPSGSINLTVTPIGIYTFLWSNGNTTEDISNVSSGVYEVTVTDVFNCTASEIFSIENITTYPVLSELIAPPTCGSKNGSIDLTINPSSTTNIFLWSTGDNTEDLLDIPAGNYSVTVTDTNGCTATGDYLIPDYAPIELTIDADLSSYIVNGTVICSLEINIPLAALDSIIWSPQSMMSCHDLLCLEQIFTLEQPSQIFVMAMDTNGCMGTASLFLNVDVEYKVYIPNVFTPNNDGPNDKFTVYANDEVEEVVELEIFDRWGNCVFINETFPPNDPSYGWDGVFKGQMMNPAVYAYRAIVRLSTGNERAYKGDVTLVR